jgi:copper transport protein
VVIVLAHRSLLASDGRPARPVEVWTTKGLWAVGVLVITGVLQMWRTVDRPGSLGDTAYGRTLVGKTALVVFVLVIAVMLRGVLRRHGPRSARSLFVSQTVLALMVTGVSVGLAGAAPNERPSSVPVTVSARADDLTASLTLTPARAGSNDVHLVVSEVGATEPTRAARAVLANPERGLTDLVIPLVPDGPDHYSAYAVQIAVPGTWQVRLEVDTSSGTVTLDLQVTVSDR